MDKTEDMVLLIEVGEMPSMHKVSGFKEAISIIKSTVSGERKEILQAIRDGKISLYKRDGKKELRMKAHFI